MKESVGVMTNQRVRVTKQLIKDALAGLLCSADAHQISISGLCQAAKVNRSTFYAHYKDIEEVIADIEAEFLEHVAFLSWKSPREENRAALQMYLEYVTGHKAAYTALIKSGRLLDKGAQIAVERYLAGVRSKDAPEVKKQCLVISGSCVGATYMINRWLETQECSMQELTGILLDLFAYASQGNNAS
ncbi:MAG TPA: TetR/AcrR family transcriptional regulator [Methanocorpusculum sp.]|nr:TetR/AcrR family transcriptional regulator [Methanocorpusculum sp.]